MNKIALGTAQFGLNYGINNKNGEIKEKEVFDILDYAHASDIRFIDTARVYGKSENKTGDYLENNKNNLFKIITKIPKCKNDEIEKHFKESLTALKQNQIYGCLMHSYDEYKANKRLWSFLKYKKEENIIEKIGFSLYYPYELEELIKDNIEFDLIQIPYNIFDRRFENYLEMLKNNGVEIHSRSVFLQGIFFKDVNLLEGNLINLKSKIELLKKISIENDISILELSLNFALENKSISKVIVGVDSIQHLKQIISASEKQIDFKKIESSLLELVENDEKLILPFNWN